MDFIFTTVPTAIATILGALILISFLLFISRDLRRKANNKRAAPQAGGAWPLIGHLHLLGGPELPHIVLGKMADKYGPIFTIRMGVHQALVVNNSEIAKECLTTHDRVFASRPKTIAMEILGFNYSNIGFSPYGHYWRQARKLATLELLSNHRLEKLKHVREAEIKASMKELYEVWADDKGRRGDANKVLVEMQRWFGDVTLNVILRMIVGKRCNKVEERGGWKEVLRSFFELSGKFLVSDALPFLRCLDIGGDERLMKKTAKEMDVLIQGLLEEHKRNRDSREANEGEDFMDTMFSLSDIAQRFPGRDADSIIKNICLTLILAAPDTTTITLTWALSLLLNNPDALKKAQNELDIHVGKERQVIESDIKNLVYLQAIFKETMRLYPPGPLAVPHESLEDCIVNDYHIPAGTRLLLNIWKIHRDPLVWSDPYEFQPERFLTTHKDFDVRGQHFELIPFSSGRRMCPAVSFALQVMHLTLASFLHGFDIEAPSNEPLDMSSGIGLSVSKTTPLEVFLSPRLPVFLYD